MKNLGLILALSLAACQGGTQPKTLSEIDQAHEWQRTPGAELNASFSNGVKHVLMAMSREDAIAAVKAEGYECIYGEGNEDYPEPAAQCTKSFATRACQMDWEIFLTSDPKKPGKVDDVDGSYMRDCVGTKDDWPEKKVSPIDDQLAPAQPPG